ncbi:aminotransferase class IV [Natronincola ferrireducens]|uniref:4-amino-4-deoxychorismate lyase n=1 Tax=Natronincola ferrireducens TaxID=393762 RepID=A0A1G9DVK6_9FIRM|nr:aminotransferase class IV [Natronincola ferrireducens]SDK67888.1 4-amino-4-deoxychorismate lyase [Natronincola ferrireducens]
MYISINGQLIKEEEVVLSPMAEAFAYGYGVFETIKYDRGRIYFLQEHIQRLKNGCRELRIYRDIDEELLKKWFDEIKEANQLSSGVLKISCVKNKEKEDIILSIRRNPYRKEAYSQGFKLCFTNIRRNPYSILTYTKSNNYLENLLARQEAMDKGYNEVIFTNVHEKICEGALSNIFFVKDQVLYTPAVSCGILDGIMRRKILEIANMLPLKVRVGEYTKVDLLKADEVFVTNSLLEIMPVVEIEGKQLSLQNSSITQILRQEYECYIATLQ